MHGLARRHGISRNLIRIWVEKFEVGALDEDIAAADMLQHQQHEARITTLERLVSRLSDLLKGASKNAHQPKYASKFVVGGPVVSPSLKDAK